MIDSLIALVPTDPFFLTNLIGALLSGAVFVLAGWPLPTHRELRDQTRKERERK